jgi:DNA-binding transcriptional LysR family regulator
MNQQTEFAFFATLIKMGSLTAAAREMDITTAAVSKRLAALEERIGVRLLNRTTRRISPTVEGEVYLAEARRILADIEELEMRLSSARSNPKGLLRVNATLGFGRRYIAPLVSEFSLRYPEMEVQLQLTDRPINLADESFDVGIRFGELPDTRLIARRIAANRRLLCASPLYLKTKGEPLVPDDLAHHNCIVLRQNDSAYGIWRLTQGKKTATVKVRGSLSTNDGEVALGWALKGHGILMRAEWDLAKYLRSGRLQVILSDYELPPADIYAVYPERHSLSGRVSAFVEFLIAQFNASAPVTDEGDAHW